MINQKLLLTVSTVTSLITLTTANYVINQQYKKIKEMSQLLVLMGDSLTKFSRYVPQEVLVETFEKLSFWDIARKYNLEAEEPGGG